jgi:hypothetical protein
MRVSGDGRVVSVWRIRFRGFALDIKPLLGGHRGREVLACFLLHCRREPNDGFLLIERRANGGSPLDNDVLCGRPMPAERGVFF